MRTGSTSWGRLRVQHGLSGGYEAGDLVYEPGDGEPTLLMSELRDGPAEKPHAGGPIAADQPDEVVPAGNGRSARRPKSGPKPRPGPRPGPKPGPKPGPRPG